MSCPPAVLGQVSTVVVVAVDELETVDVLDVPQADPLV
jgi:hypothetical protein